MLIFPDYSLIFT